MMKQQANQESYYSMVPKKKSHTTVSIGQLIHCYNHSVVNKEEKGLKEIDSFKFTHNILLAWVYSNFFQLMQ